MVSKKIFLLTIFFLLIFSSGWSQAPETDAQSQAQIKKLAFITGKWKGMGWMIGREGKKRSFNQTENVQFKIDSTAVLIEGKGKANGKMIHNALAVVTFDKENGNYSFQSYLATGRSGNFNAELKGEKFYWFPNENMRYIIYLNEKNQWYEIGEMKRSGKWVQFFEMTLDKVEQ